MDNHYGTALPAVKRGAGCVQKALIQYGPESTSLAACQAQGQPSSLVLGLLSFTWCRACWWRKATI